MPLSFERGNVRFDSDLGRVGFRAVNDADEIVNCAVDVEALKNRAGIHRTADDDLLSIYRRYADEIHTIVERKYRAGDRQPDGLILVNIHDLNDLTRFR